MLLNNRGKDTFARVAAEYDAVLLIAEKRWPSPDSQEKAKYGC